VQGGWSGTVQTRIIGKAKLNNAWGPQDVDDNDIPAQYYLDLRGSYKLDNGIQLYAALDNALDRDPPVIPFTANSASAYETPFVDAIYNSFGRLWRAGVRVDF
jgi:outer membrane receptor protein involved in Fe transport